MTNIKTRHESGWKNYLIKAEQFLETARDAYFKENWNAVGLNAVHSAISANDALTSYYGKVRSISEKHSDSISLLLEVFKNDKESKSCSRHISWLINRKNLVEYESRLFYEKEAEESLKHADRFLFWAKGKLPK
ncbi:HEPN domain-containing protein [Patescibacteria group bacterium]|nr:HEPN domain-containing protein [Candidatus Falkowbacteria bacterium]MBU3906582.1 HEPN domain-containing protein [Patescibacteria group bacterium]MBU4015771.1 HEPN domain-containing protein [Patescibacteria group bacterium]MBU4027098.1 HEPN domain-containing protein [Patescibacteria group bacterium]MBU4073666.1 HEPN domain-containing protein [Patescibacteria group bacterium]